MSTAVCQPVQPQFSPWFDLFEPCAIWFSLSVSSQDRADNSLVKLQQSKENPHNVQNHVEIDKKNTINKESVKGWSFLQALAETTQVGSKENEHVFVHPLAKNSASKLSEKSLEMCTESLGSESGSENGDDLMISLGSETHRRSKMVGVEVTKRLNCGYNFPPPLTTISGGGCSGGGVRVEHLRENGRLVIKATNVGTPKGCFKAERSGGRLRLHFVSCDDQEYFDENVYDDDDNNDDDYDDNGDDWDEEYDCVDEGDDIW